MTVKRYMSLQASQPGGSKLHPGETPAQYRRRIGHVNTDPRTWGPLAGNPDAYLLNATMVTHPCGCEVVGNGTLPYPVTVLWCPLHEAAGDLLAAVEEALAFLQENIPVSTEPAGGLPTRRVLVAAIAKVRGA